MLVEISELMKKVANSEGDLKVLTPDERAQFYVDVCESVGLNPLTQPLNYIELKGRLTLYAGKGATEQLRKIHMISVNITDRSINNEVYVVTAKGRDKTGREDESIGAVSIKGVYGEALANAFMKAETKAKRRVTLSLVGLGWMDESELDTIPPNDKGNSFAPSISELDAKTVNKELQSKPESGTESAGEQITQNTTEQKPATEQRPEQKPEQRPAPEQEPAPVSEPVATSDSTEPKNKKTVKIILGRLQNIIEKNDIVFRTVKFLDDGTIGGICAQGQDVCEILKTTSGGGTYNVTVLDECPEDDRDGIPTNFKAVVLF